MTTVDELATRGTCVGAFGSTIPGKEWARTRLDGELHPIKTRLGMEAQLEIKISKQEGGWLVIESLKPAPEHIQTIRDKNTWIVQAAHSPQQYENLTCVEIMETERVMRSQNEIGTLNLIPLPNLSDTQISEAYEETVRLIAEDRNATSVRKAEATLKAHKAYKALEYTPQRDKVIDRLIKAPQRITREARCPIDVKALREFIASPASLDQVENSEGKRKACTVVLHLLETASPRLASGFLFWHNLSGILASQRGF